MLAVRRPGGAIVGLERREQRDDAGAELPLSVAQSPRADVQRRSKAP